MSVVIGFAATAADPSDARWLHDAAQHSAAVGPDAQDVWIEGAVGLAHAALHVSVDTPTSQPHSLDGQVWISADVRLDDRETLRHALAAFGRRPPALADDARLTLEAYLAWGEQCLARLAGDFAFAIWDGRTRRLFCARDQMGVVPFYLAERGNRLYVSTSLDALLLHPETSDALDERSVGDFLTVSFVRDVSATMYQAVRRLPPAHSLTWQNGRVETRRYWRVPEWTGFLTLEKPADYAERFRDVLGHAVADRARCDVLGVQLSGGLDSTMIAALAARASGERGTPRALRAYTATAHTVMADREGEFAARVADALGLEIEWIDLGACADVDPLDTPPGLTPEPWLYRRTSLEHEFVTRPARHCRVVLTGLGGDVLLGSDPAQWLRWLVRGEFRRATTSLAEHVRLFGTRPPLGLRALAAGLHPARARRAPTVPDWVDRGFASRNGLHERQREIVRASWTSDTASGLATWPFWSELLGHGHPAFTGTPVRFRHPFFDLRLLSMALSLPPRPWLSDKRVLREAARTLLPESVRRRPKAPLPRGVGAALRSERGAQSRLVDLVADTPQLDRFLDRERLQASMAAEKMAEPFHNRLLPAALGLAHWMHHRRRPRVAIAGAFRAVPHAAERLFAPTP